MAVSIQGRELISSHLASDVFFYFCVDKCNFCKLIAFGSDLRTLNR